MKLEWSASRLLLVTLSIWLAVLAAGCRTQPASISSSLGPAETFQRAQDASGAGNYALAIRYYTAYRDSHPDNKDRDIWALYEIAFNYHKMGKTTKAIEILDQLLKQYQTEGNTLPPAPRILAQKLKESWSQKTQ